MKKLADWYDNLFIPKDDQVKQPTWVELIFLFILIIGFATLVVYFVFIKEYPV